MWSPEGVLPPCSPFLTFLLYDISVAGFNNAFFWGGRGGVKKEYIYINEWNVCLQMTSPFQCNKVFLKQMQVVPSS